MKALTDAGAVVVVVVVVFAAAAVGHDRFEHYPSCGYKQKASFLHYLGAIVAV
jgi:hypothetical protein